jgi:hypothetical protein
MSGDQNFEESVMKNFMIRLSAWFFLEVGIWLILFMYRKIKVSVGVVPMLFAENRIPNTFCPQGIILKMNLYR